MEPNTQKIRTLIIKQSRSDRHVLLWHLLSDLGSLYKYSTCSPDARVAHPDWLPGLVDANLCKVTCHQTTSRPSPSPSVSQNACSIDSDTSKHGRGNGNQGQFGHLQNLNLGSAALQRDNYLTMETINKTLDGTSNPLESRLLQD